MSHYAKTELAKKAVRPTEERVIRALANKLWLQDRKLFALIRDQPSKRPAAALAILVLASVKSSLVKYKGFSDAEREGIILRVILLIQTEEREEDTEEIKPLVVRSDAKRQRTPSTTARKPRGVATNVSNGPVKAPRVLTERQRQQAAATPAPQPAATPATTRTTRPKGAPKAVPKTHLQSDQQRLESVLDSLFRADSDLKLLFEAGGLNGNDETINQAISQVTLSQPRNAKATLKRALQALLGRYAQEAVIAQEQKIETPVTERISQPRSTKPTPAKERPADKVVPEPRAIPDDLMKKIEGAAARLKDSGPAEVAMSSVMEEKVARAMAFLTASP